MGKFAQLVLGPAGSGKSTFCDIIRKHCENIRRSVHVINLDPAAEEFLYPVSIDVRELISLSDVTEDLSYGPNGGLIFCLEHLLDNMDWFKQQLGDFDDDYVLIDCPGQIEIYTHIPILKRFVAELMEEGYTVCGVHLLDSHFVTDIAKFISGTFVSLSAMTAIQIPFVNVITKMDLVPEKQREDLERFFDPEFHYLADELTEATGEKFRKLNDAIAMLLDDYQLVRFIPLDITDEDSISVLLQHIDNSIQYGEDLDTKLNYPDEVDPEQDAGDEDD